MPRKRAEEVLARARREDWVVGLVAGVIALAALVIGSTLGKPATGAHASQIEPRVVKWTATAGVLIFGALATRRISVSLGHLVTRRTIPSAGAAVRLVSSGIGYLIVIFSIFAVLEVSVERLLVGAGLAGVLLGLAAQQSLGNVFAGLVLLFARPFTVGQHIRIRSGALGGVFDGTVLEMSLTYVTLLTDDGVFKIPNSGMLAAGVGIPPTGPSATETGGN